MLRTAKNFKNYPKEPDYDDCLLQPYKAEAKSDSELKAMSISGWGKG